MSKVWLSVHIEEERLDELADHILEFRGITEEDLAIDDPISEDSLTLEPVHSEMSRTT